jgi:hypothetical protein
LSAERPEAISTETTNWQQLLLEKDLEILRLQRRNKSLERNIQLEQKRKKNPVGNLSALKGLGQGIYGATSA